MSTDVLISFDTTGSMAPCIAEVRRRVKEAVSELLTSIDDLRIGIISHGDYCDGPHSIIDIDFTDEIGGLIEFIANAPNTSGGDSDELYELVLQNAKHFAWQADNRILILIGDALPHQVGYNYNGFINRINWLDEAKSLADMGVHIYSVQALGKRNSTRFYETLADVTNGRKLDLNQFSDAVETIIAISYHGSGDMEMLKDYQTGLEAGFKMNRNLAALFIGLDARKVSVSGGHDRSGLEPVPPFRFQVLHVDHPTDIKSFVLATGATFKKGRGFYQFTKKETIQEYKEVVLQNKWTGDMFTGAEAREFIGLPFGYRGDIRPAYTDEYNIFVQSTSVNRRLLPGTLFLYENE